LIVCETTSDFFPSKHDEPTHYKDKHMSKLTPVDEDDTVTPDPPSTASSAIKPFFNNN
jgi:hypothetical protein